MFRQLFDRGRQVLGIALAVLLGVAMIPLLILGMFTLSAKSLLVFLILCSAWLFAGTGAMLFALLSVVVVSMFCFRSKSKIVQSVQPKNS